MSGPLVVTNPASWERIARQARDQAAGEVELLELPAFGEPIAWGERAIHWLATDDLSEIHRVGVSVEGEPYTTCGVPIPHKSWWLVLGPAVLQNVDHCRFCEAEHAHARLNHFNAA